jgi:hypothetical protein
VRVQQECYTILEELRPDRKGVHMASERSEGSSGMRIIPGLAANDY